MAYKKLFEPGRIGGLTIRNRAVMSPMGTDLADIRGNATPRLIAYYTERAKGGIGLIINEYTGVDDVDSIPTQHNLRMAQDYNVQEAEELTRSVHAYGAKIFAQLHHGGATSKSAFTGRQNLSPSGVPMAPGGEVPREMTLEDIKRVQEKFIAAAIRCKKAGYDGVDHTTATGTFVHKGVAAVDKRVFPLGSDLYVMAKGMEYGLTRAEDTGMKGPQIDLYMESYQECIQFGRRTGTVYLLED